MGNFFLFPTLNRELAGARLTTSLNDFKIIKKIERMSRRH
jgi:hypothetical protein